MNRQILLKRGKGLLAFVIAFMMMFGMPLEVFAKDISLYQENEIVSEGGVIELTYVSGGAHCVYIDDKLVTNSEGTYEYNGDENLIVEEVVKNDLLNGYIEYTLRLKTITPSPEPDPGTTPPPDLEPVPDPPTTPDPETDPVPTPPSSSGGSHQHSFSWILALEPTETKDGRYDYRCECGHVEASQPVSFLGAIVKKIILSIEQAPANGTVLVENQFLRCLTNEIMEALKKRPDVTLEVKFTDQEVPYHFVIPAGQLPAEESEWYGYYYLGSVYGWKE